MGWYSVGQLRMPPVVLFIAFAMMSVTTVTATGKTVHRQYESDFATVTVTVVTHSSQQDPAADGDDDDVVHQLTAEATAARQRHFLPSEYSAVASGDDGSGGGYDWDFHRCFSLALECDPAGTHLPPAVRNCPWDEICNHCAYTTFPAPFSSTIKAFCAEYITRDSPNPGPSAGGSGNSDASAAVEENNNVISDGGNGVSQSMDHLEGGIYIAPGGGGVVETAAQAHIPADPCHWKGFDSSVDCCASTAATTAPYAASAGSDDAPFAINLHDGGDDDRTTIATVIESKDDDGRGSNKSCLRQASGGSTASTAALSNLERPGYDDDVDLLLVPGSVVNDNPTTCPQNSSCFESAAGYTKTADEVPTCSSGNCVDVTNSSSLCSNVSSKGRKLAPHSRPQACRHPPSPVGLAAAVATLLGGALMLIMIGAGFNGDSDKRETPTNAHTSSMDVRQFKLNWKPQPEAELAQYPRLKLITADLPSETLLPPSKDLAQNWPVKRNQCNVGACVAFASTAAMEYVARSCSSSCTLLSPRFVHYCARVMTTGSEPSDDTAGTHISTAMAALRMFGAAPETLCPHSAPGDFQICEEPSKAAFAAAVEFQVLRAVRIDMDNQSLKAAIAAGMPVMAGFTCYENLYDDDVQSTGVIKMPKGDRIGGHCVLFVGYDDAKKLFKFRNSWGADWGHEGYGYMPYDFAERSDGWAIAVVEEKGEIVELINRQKATMFGLQMEDSLCGEPANDDHFSDMDDTSSSSNVGVDTSCNCSQPENTHHGGDDVVQKLRILSLTASCEDMVRVVQDCQTGYIAAGSGAIKVRNGAWSWMRFTIEMRAVTCAQISDLDSSLLGNLSEQEKSIYQVAKQHYDGGFNVPVLSWFGVHMNAEYDEAEVDARHNANPSYNRQARDIVQNLEHLAEQRITLDGELQVSGLSFAPTDALAYVKVVQLKLTSGKSLNVINTDTPDGLQGGDSTGVALPTRGQRLKLMRSTVSE